jgi:hypothetical protein
VLRERRSSPERGNREGVRDIATILCDCGSHVNVEDVKAIAASGSATFDGKE